MTASKISTETETDKTAPVSPLTNGAATVEPEDRDQDDLQATKDETPDVKALSKDPAEGDGAKSDSGAPLARKPASDDDQTGDLVTQTRADASAGAKDDDGGQDQASRSGSNPLMVVLAALLGALVAVLLTEGLRSNTVPAAVEAQLRDLRTEIEAIRVASGDPEAVTTIRNSLGEMRNRIADVEAVSREAQRQASARATSATGGPGLASLQGSVGNLSEGQARLQNRVAALEGATPANLVEELATKADEAAVQALTNRVGQLERNDVAQDARRAALALAVANLTRSSQTSQPFATELQALSLLTEADPAVGGMEQYAAQGLPSLEDLRRDFAGLAPRVVRAWRISEKQGVLGRIWANILGSVSIRPVGEATGNLPPALVARAEMRLSEGNLAGAVQELETLEGESANVASTWLSAARSRLELDRLVTDLNGRVIASIASDEVPPAAGE